MFGPVAGFLTYNRGFCWGELDEHEPSVQARQGNDPEHSSVTTSAT